MYATFDDLNDDYAPYVYGARLWADVAVCPRASPGLGQPIREHPRTRACSWWALAGRAPLNDGGASWLSLATNMPTLPVADLLIHPRDNALIVSLHGRGIWILDDLGPLEALTADVVRSDAHVMPIPRARLWSIWWPQAWFGAGEFFAPNPDYGAVITYYLRDAASGPCSSGARCRGDPDSRPAGARESRTESGGVGSAPESPLTEPSTEQEVMGGYGGPPRAPLVLPGRYTVAVRVPGIGRELQGDVTVEAIRAPRSPTRTAAPDRGAAESLRLETLDGARVTSARSPVKPTPSGRCSSATARSLLRGGGRARRPGHGGGPHHASAGGHHQPGHGRERPVARHRVVLECADDRSAARAGLGVRERDPNSGGREPPAPAGAAGAVHRLDETGDRPAAPNADHDPGASAVIFNGVRLHWVWSYSPMQPLWYRSGWLGQRG